MVFGGRKSYLHFQSKSTLFIECGNIVHFQYMSMNACSYLK